MTPGLVVIGVDVGQVVGRVALFRDVVVTDVALAVNAVSLKVSLWFISSCWIRTVKLSTMVIKSEFLQSVACANFHPCLMFESKAGSP